MIQFVREITQHDKAFLPIELVGVSSHAQQARRFVTQAALSDASVLLTGERGTGKEAMARCIHRDSARSGYRFVPLNCAAMPDESLEQEIFGSADSSYVGATLSPGRTHVAQKGTLFLDEIGNATPYVQVRLQRVMRDYHSHHIDSAHEEYPDFRIIGASSMRIEDLVVTGEFREDLYYRLSVLIFHLHPLRERPEDIEPIIDNLLARQHDKSALPFSLTPAALEALKRYSWPGNIPELISLVERLETLYPGEEVDVPLLPVKFQKRSRREAAKLSQLPDMQLPPEQWVDHLALPMQGIDLKRHLASVELRLITQALEETGGTVSEAARLLKLRRTTLVEKLRRYGDQAAGLRRERTQAV